jgi:putative ABC transport system permease protein
MDFTFSDVELIGMGLRLLASMVLLGIILIVSNQRKLDLRNRIFTAGLRGLIQLLTLSVILVYVFSLTSIIYQFLILGFMIFFGAQAASKRLSEIDGVFNVEIIAISISVYSIMLIITLIGAIPIDNPAIWIPIGGMATGNAMNISYLTLNRIKGEIDNRREQIEAALSLGLTPFDTMDQLKVMSKGLKMGITPSMNNLRTLGLVFIPGLMTGMLIGGINPIVAAIYQVFIFFVLIAAGLITSVIASKLIISHIFDMENQSLI